MERLESLLSRKFLFGLLLIIMGFVLVEQGKVDVKYFFTFAEIVGGTYVLGNVATGVTSEIVKKFNE
jgi:hypothetical protein